MSAASRLSGAPGPAFGVDDWAAAFFSDADKLDLPLLMTWFDDAVDLRIANLPPIIGIAGAQQAFSQFWSTLAGMSHRRDALVVDGDSAFQASIVTYTRLDGHPVPLPVASHLRRRGNGRLDRLWIYIDLLPLYAEA